MKVAIITSSFPYLPGEQFIETEIGFWGNTTFDEVYLLPSSSKGLARPVPENVFVDRGLAKKTSKVRCAIRALISSVFYREVKFLYANRNISVESVFLAWKSAATFLRSRTLLFNWLEKKGPFELIYTYWNAEYSYAACVAKEQGLVRKVISRAHRFDLYEERRPKKYMPLKRQFIQKLDQLYVLSNEAKAYVNRTYALETGKISVSPLGVGVPQIICLASSPQDFKVVSVSFCVPVKRVDKIIGAIARFASLKPELNISWTHIGEGLLKDGLMRLARDEFKELGNVSFQFPGHLSNKEVRSLYSEQEVDCFVNASESEGVPVSIMEAMIAGVPIIAPDVGGISELVGKDCGVLMSADPDIDELCEAFLTLVVAAKSEKVRMCARERASKLHDAEKNYPAFIKSLEKLVLTPETGHMTTSQ